MILLNRGGVLNVPNVSFVDEDSSVRYLVDIKIEYEYVDLGLPSGLKWATCNVGADSPEKAGVYFAWGETTGYTAEQVTGGERVFDDATYQSGPAASISSNLTLEQDAAHINMGEDWRMPTLVEFIELIDNCDHTWTDDYNGTGAAGMIFTSKSNENSVFFPAAGCCNTSVEYVGSNIHYWSASLSPNMEDKGEHLFFYSGYIDVITDNNYRYIGQSVRGVCK